MYVSVVILESAVLTAGYDKEKQEQWITIFEEIVNKKLPIGVYLDIKTCSQMGEADNYLPYKEFKKILWLSKEEADKEYDFKNILKNV